MTTVGFNSARRRLRRIQRNLEDNVGDAVERNIDAMERTAKQRIVEDNAIATFELFNAFRQFRRPTTSGTRYVLANAAPHAGYAEFGTGPRNDAADPRFKFKAPSHTPELTRAIKFWMQVKPVVPQHSLNRSAYLIARAISDTEYDARTRLPGTDPVRFMRTAWFKNERILRSDVQYAVKKTVRR